MGLYTRHAVGDGDGCQAGTAIESFIPYSCHAVRNSDGCQVGAIFKSAISNESSAFFDLICSMIFVHRLHQVSVSISDVVLYRKTDTAFESAIPYVCHAVWDSDGCQAGAVLESAIPYVCHAVRDSDGCQAGTAIESIIPYVCN